jgi:hypothetical protein
MTSESVRGGWKRIRQRRLPESDLVHYGSVLALLRPRGRTRQRKPVRRINVQRGPINLKQDRRQWLKTSASVLGASLLPLPACPRAGPGGAAPAQAKPARPVLRAFLHPAQHTLVEDLSETIIPEDSHSGGAKAARVADYIEQFREKPPTTMKNRFGVKACA